MAKARVTTSASLHLAAPTKERPVWVLDASEAEATIVSSHRHDDRAQLLVPTHGVVRVTSQDAIWIVPPSKAVVVPVAFEHSMTAPQATRLLTVNIHPAALQTDRAACRVLHVSRLTQALLDAIGSFPRDYALNSPASRIVDVLLDQLSAAPAQAFALPRPSDVRVRRISDALVEDSGLTLTLAQWGKAVGASERTLARMFEAETGMGFREYRRQVQIHAAMGLLIAGDTIGDIAHRLGYESASAFVFAFRSVTGTTPGRFRRSSE